MESGSALPGLSHFAVSVDYLLGRTCDRKDVPRAAPKTAEDDELVAVPSGLT
jgi:hypothetical protein